MDVTDLASVREATRAAEQALGAAAILVNNAGTDEFGFFKNTDEDLWQRDRRHQPDRRHARRLTPCCRG